MAGQLTALNRRRGVVARKTRRELHFVFDDFAS